MRATSRNGAKSTSIRFAPNFSRLAIVLKKMLVCWSSPKNSRSLSRGVANVVQVFDSVPPQCGGGDVPRAMLNTASASSTVRENIETQSSDGHDRTTPALLNAPTTGFRPTTLLHPAGTRPEPAVSVPSAKLTNPAATANAEPELDPPDT